MSAMLAVVSTTGQTIGVGVLTLGFLAMLVAAIRLHRPRSAIVTAALAVAVGAVVTAASASGVVFAPR